MEEDEDVVDEGPSWGERLAHSYGVVIEYTLATCTATSRRLRASPDALVALSEAMIAEVARVTEVPLTLDAVVATLRNFAAGETPGGPAPAEADDEPETCSARGAAHASYSPIGPLPGKVTWLLGNVALAVCENEGQPLPAAAARRVVLEAFRSYRCPYPGEEGASVAR